MIIPNFLSDRDPNSAFDGSPGVPNIIDKLNAWGFDGTKSLK